jgi:DNA-binding transcriptional MerR regulator
VGEEQMTLEEIQKFLDDNNTTLEKYLRANIITDEDRKEFKQKWNALMVEALYRNFEDTP